MPVPGDFELRLITTVVDCRKDHQETLAFIAKSSPQQNSYVEPFNVTTREELLELLEYVSGVEEPQVSEVAEAAELLVCLGAEDRTPSDLAEEWTSNEARLLSEIDPFESLRVNEAKIIN